MYILGLNNRILALSKILKLKSKNPLKFLFVFKKYIDVDN